VNLDFPKEPLAFAEQVFTGQYPFPCQPMPPSFIHPHPLFIYSSSSSEPHWCSEPIADHTCGTCNFGWWHCMVPLQFDKMPSSPFGGNKDVNTPGLLKMVIMHTK